MKVRLPRKLAKPHKSPQHQFPLQFNGEMRTVKIAEPPCHRENRQKVIRMSILKTVSKTHLAIASLMLVLGSASAQASTIDQAINDSVQPITDALASFIFYSVTVGGAEVPLIVCWLILGALFFTLYFKFINLRGFRHAIDIVSGRYADPDHPGEVSHFQALTTAVSGTVGIGNIAGVAIVVSLGGPGAIFWLIVAGLLGMATKFVECTLGVKYRQQNPDGSVSGGPMYYLQRGFEARGMPKIGKGLGMFFAASIVVGCLGIGNMFQSNQAFAQIVEVTGGATSILSDKGWLIGTILAVSVSIIIIGGIKSIGKVTEKLVPFMVLLYVTGALVVIGINYQAVPGAFYAIFTQAFSSDGMTGGIVGIMILGFQRAAFSNEAGLGSAAIAHSAVQTNEPLTEGYVALLEPFIDTVVICTITGLVLITSFPTETLTGSGMSGIEMTSAAFESRISWSPIPLSIAATLFAFSTMIAWAYYGIKGWTYLFGEGRRKEHVFSLIFCIFIVIGSSVQLSAILDLADALIFVMALPNLVGLFIMAPEVKKDLEVYWMAHKG